MKTAIVILCGGLVFARPSLPQVPVKLTIDTASRDYAIPKDFVGLSFETESIESNTYGVSGYFFTPRNTQLIHLFRNIGVKSLRIGGGTVDGSGSNEHCITPIPTRRDIDQLFQFAQAARIKVIYSVRLENLAACPNAHLAEEDAKIVQYIWKKYRANVDSFAIGNEPDVREYHTEPTRTLDPAIYEVTPGVAGSAFPSYFADWLHFAEVIHKAVPEAKFSGPDTAVSATSSFTPNPFRGVSWTQQFVEDLKGSGLLAEAFQHYYVWGDPKNTTAQEAIDAMLSMAWDQDTSIGKQQAYNGGTAEFHPYPFVYRHIFAPLVSYAVPYRITEANDCLHGVPGASDGFDAALWALDYMHWWAAHHMAGVNFHNTPWIPTDTIVPDPVPCRLSGCGNYRAAPKALGIKAFSLGSKGFVKPIRIANVQKINLTAYAVGTREELYVTIINKTHTSTDDATDADVLIEVPGFDGAGVDEMTLTDGHPGNASLMTGTLGGSTIANDRPWKGRWTAVGRVRDERIKVTVQSTTAQVVRIRMMKEHAAE